MPDHFTDENEGKPVKPFTEAERRKFRGSNCFICGYNGANYFQPSIHACARRYHADEEVYAAALESAVERLQRELDEARGIVRAIHWMACRYADGRNTYAPGMYNRAIAKAYDAGWLTFDPARNRYDVQYARDGMSPEWKTVEERATSAEASLAKAREALAQVAEHKERDEGVTGFERAEIHGEPVAAKRVETGPVRIGDDWAGLFLRGDNALFMAHAVARAADALRATDPLTAVMVDGLVTDMRSCQEPCEARPLYAHPDPAVERLQRELDEARGRPPSPKEA